MGHTPTAYGYARVSTTKQELSIEGQQDKINTYYGQRLTEKFIFGGTFVDHGVSAYRVPFPERPEGSKAFRLLQPGDILIASSMDRMFRSVIDLGKTLEYFRKIEVSLALIDFDLDTSTAIGQMMAEILASVAKFESAHKADRLKNAFGVRRGRKSAKGKATPPPGWYWSKKKEQFVADYVERDLIKQILEWNDLGIRSVSKTCIWLKEEGVTRRDHKQPYRKQWVYHARAMMEAGWPLEGFIRHAFEQETEAERQKRIASLNRLKASSTERKRLRKDLQTISTDRLREALSKDDPV